MLSSRWQTPSRHPHPESPLLLGCPCCLLIDNDPQSPHPLPPSSTLSSSTSSSSDATPPTLLVPVSGGPPATLLSPEQHRRGEEDPIHPPSSYFLLIVVFVAVKEIIVFNTPLQSHSSVCCPAIPIAAAVAIVAVAPWPLHHPAPPHGILSAVG